MDIVPFHPLREMDRLRQTLDRFLAEPLIASGPAAGHPALRLPIEVLDRGQEVVVRAELPGMDPQDVEVRVTDDGMTLRGERKLATDQDRDGIRHTERFYGTVVRSIAFPGPVDAARATAEFRNGVLEVRAPRRQAEDGRDGRRLDIQTH